MSPVLVLALNSWVENLRNRFFALTLAFAGVVLYLSMLLGLLACDQEVRVLLDFGLGLIELMGLVGAVYCAATVVLREMETKTVYMILTRPVDRTRYLLGRFLGLMLSAGAAMLIMSAAHLMILLLKGWDFRTVYLWALLGVFLKVLVTASLAMFLALLATSALSALSITMILWSLGHFLPEIRLMVRRFGSDSAAVMAPLKAVSWVIPDLQLFNLRDKLDLPAHLSSGVPAGSWLLYAGCYCAVWLAMAAVLFRRKEF
ncbi:MAG: ABC transporter permease subunit [Elusimicrobia bacterium]|nr:ABC transporter permease subunit [Elusimicrobiota bacterium]